MDWTGYHLYTAEITPKSKGLINFKEKKRYGYVLNIEKLFDIPIMEYEDQRVTVVIPAGLL